MTSVRRISPNHATLLLMMKYKSTKTDKQNIAAFGLVSRRAQTVVYNFPNVIAARVCAFDWW